jgi:hypothetical protein
VAPRIADQIQYASARAGCQVVYAGRAAG